MKNNILILKKRETNSKSLSIRVYDQLKKHLSGFRNRLMR
jgi:hypothetical protein